MTALFLKTWKLKPASVFFLLAFVSATHAQVDRSTAFDFNRRLGRGINYMASKINADQHHPLDFRLVRKNHFTHIRIGGHLWKPENVSDDGNFTIDPARMQGFKNAVDWALAERLMVVMDPIHYWRDYEEKDLLKLEKLWEQIATTFAHYPVDRVAFEIMNEPESYEFDLKAIINTSLNAIRSNEGNEKRVVIVSGQGFSTRQALITALNNDIFPTDDPYLIGTFHYYDPRSFTKQGETGPLYWAESGDDDPDWTAVSNAFDQVMTANESWAARNRTSALPLYCGEFGVDNGAPESDRLRWLWWIRTVSEERGFSTAVWNLYNHDPNSKGIGPWGQEQINDPSSRSLDADVVEAVMTRYEMEASLLSGLLLKANLHDGASGRQYVDFSSASAQAELLTSSIYLGKGGEYDLSLRYRNESDGDYALRIRVYDSSMKLIDEQESVSLPTTGETWNTTRVELTFPAGSDISVRISALQASPLLSLDYLCITEGLYFDNLYPP